MINVLITDGIVINIYTRIINSRIVLLINAL